MLRGPQTVGELKQRSERLHRFGSIAEVGDVLEGLTQRELVARLERRQGQKEERWQQLLGGDAEATAEPVAPVVTPEADEGADRIGAIEERLERLEGAFDELIARLDKVPDRE